jgi:riboflavin kinase/FMN adenylyltransferase
VWITSSLNNALTPTIAALGNFDGIHRGHIRVIEPILSLDRWNLDPETRSGAKPHSTVVTFTPHPQEFFTGQPKALLTPLPEKVELLEKLGVEQLILLPFNRELANLSPRQFVESILIQRLCVKGISVGQDFCFGHRRSGTAKDLRTIAADYQTPVEIVSLEIVSLQQLSEDQAMTSDPVPAIADFCTSPDSDQRISSSAIREALQQGDLLRANRLLGRPYSLQGEVVEGRQLGRTIGFPTANLDLPGNKFLPRQGVYSVWVTDSTLEALMTPHPGVMNMGVRPTVSGEEQTVEIHLLDWSRDLYGHTLTVTLEQFIRPEQKFASLDALKTQIQRDCDLARKQLKS